MLFLKKDFLSDIYKSSYINIKLVELQNVATVYQTGLYHKYSMCSEVLETKVIYIGSIGGGLVGDMPCMLHRVR